jgi:hypothetical protein
MKKETLYTQWKEHRRQVPVPGHFAVDVMAKIESKAHKEEYELPAGLTDIHNRLMQWSAAAGLVLLGLFRIFYIAANLLRANQLLP